MMLVAAKWREFSSLNPHSEEPEAEDDLEPNYIPKPSRSRSSAAKVIIFNLINKYFRVMVVLIFVFV